MSGYLKTYGKPTELSIQGDKSQTIRKDGKAT